MKTQNQTGAVVSLVKRFNMAHGRFLEHATASGPRMVVAVNCARAMGILLKELIGRENLTENCIRAWLRENPNVLAEQNVSRLMNYMRLSNKVADKIERFADASREVVQLTLENAGILPPPGPRLVAQKNHDREIVEVSWKLFANLKDKFEKLVKDRPNWDERTRAAVVGNIIKARMSLDEFKAKLVEIDSKTVEV